MTNDTYLQRLLSFDPLAQAEELTGMSYKEDDTTMGLGMLMQMENGARKREALQENNDTYWSMDFLEAVDVILDLGFTPIYAQTKLDTDRDYATEQPVHFQGYWRDGILLMLESYQDKVNTLQVYFNYRNSDGKTTWPDWTLGLSGGWERMTPGFDGYLDDDPWTLCVHMDGREGLRHKLKALEALPGYVLEEWYIRPFLYFVSYVEEDRDQDTSTSDKAWKRITEEKIEHFSEPVRSMILETPER